MSKGTPTGRKPSGPVMQNIPVRTPEGQAVKDALKRKRATREVETRIAGEGSDGGLYGVTTMSTSGGDKMLHRASPCPTCPWRKDAEIGRFPPDAYRHSARTAEDGAFNTFACHESGKKAVATCAGFLLANSAHNMGVRMAMFSGRFDPRKVKANGVELYGSYKEMAVANGVPPDDKALAMCRGDNEEPPYLRMSPEEARARREAVEAELGVMQPVAKKSRQRRK